MEKRLRALIHQQFAVDFGEDRSFFSSANHLFKTGVATKGARYWAREKGDIVLYRDNIYCRTERQDLTQKLRTLYQDSPGEWFLEMGNIDTLNDILNPYGLKIIHMAPFFVFPATASHLSDKMPHNGSNMLLRQELEVSQSNLNSNHPGRFRVVTEKEIMSFKDDDRINEAFAFEEADPDKVGYAYYENDELIAIAGANQNGQYTFEIGIQFVKEGYEGRGIAAALVQKLATKIWLDYPDVFPVYGTQFSHTKSMNVAINAGMVLGWTEVMIGKTKN